MLGKNGGRSMKSKKMCVQHRDGWCVAKNENECLEENDNIETLCHHFIILPWGFKKRNPTCPDCLKILEQIKNT